MERNLSELVEDELRSIAADYGSLRPCTADRLRSGMVRSFAATATVKILSFVRPRAVHRVGEKISAHIAGHLDESGFAMHLQIRQG